jgi:hypothetical protein
VAIFSLYYCFMGRGNGSEYDSQATPSRAKGKKNRKKSYPGGITEKEVKIYKKAAKEGRGPFEMSKKEIRIHKKIDKARRAEEERIQKERAEDARAKREHELQNGSLKDLIGELKDDSEIGVEWAKDTDYSATTDARASMTEKDYAVAYESWSRPDFWRDLFHREEKLVAELRIVGQRTRNPLQRLRIRLLLKQMISRMKRYEAEYKSRTRSVVGGI